MAYDSDRARVVVWGGETPLGYDGSLWEWDGTTWTETPAPAIAPVSAPSPALVYDSARSRLVAFGGESSRYAWSGGASQTWEYGSLVPSSATSLGQPCASGGYQPTLIAFGKPALGNASFALDVHRAEPLAPCAFGLSAGQATSPIGGCVLHLQAPIVAVAGTVDAIGRASLPLPVPAVPALYGVDLYGQAYGIRPASAPPGLWLSNGSSLTLGE
jgi:hypothetical protein